MIARFVAMVAVLAFAVVSAATVAHAAHMGAVADHAVHVNEMAMINADNGPSCGGEHHCGSADAQMCAFVCAGLSGVLPLERGDAGLTHVADEHDPAFRTSGRGRTPGLNERPPKLRLL
jgi:hypothetical protein